MNIRVRAIFLIKLLSISLCSHGIENVQLSHQSVPAASTKKDMLERAGDIFLGIVLPTLSIMVMLTLVRSHYEDKMKKLQEENDELKQQLAGGTRESAPGQQPKTSSVLGAITGNQGLYRKPSGEEKRKNADFFEKTKREVGG